MKNSLVSLAVTLATLGLANPAQGAILSFKANLDSSQVVSNPSNSSATGTATFLFDSDLNQLNYFLTLDGLDLEPIVANRLEFDDVDKIHIHAGAPGEVGPHVLNIFGLPSEDDDNLVVNFNDNSLSGIWDDSDAIDPVTGAPFDQTADGTTKFLSNFVDDLQSDNLYLAVHTIGSGGGVTIRGQIEREKVPEPSTLFSTGAVLTCAFISLKRKSNIS